MTKQLTLDPLAHHLGVLCQRAHNWQDTGLSRRSLKHGHCLQCAAEVAKERRKSDPEFKASVNAAAACRRTAKPYKRTPEQDLRQKELRRTKTLTTKQKADKVKAQTKYHNKRKATDPYFATVLRLRDRFKKAIKRVLNGKPQRSNKYGINYAAIVAHLGTCPGELSLYHIDHIKPVNDFDLTDPQQVAQCFAPENHRWLLAVDNLKKNKY